MEHVTVEELARTIRIGVNLIYISTDNERRTESLIQQTAARMKGLGSPYLWTCTEGLRRDGVAADGTLAPADALDFARKEPGPLLFLFKDLSFFWDDPFVRRRLKDFSATGRSKVLIVIGTAEVVPEALKEDFVILNQGLPTLAEIRSFLEELKAKDPRLAAACGKDADLIGQLAVAGRGLDLIDIERAVRTLGVARHDGEVSGMIEALFECKRFAIKKSGIMEFVDNRMAGNQLGGMENLKVWLQRRERAFGVENLQTGVNLPKGVLIMGIAGCGKSLFVKAIAAQWNLPLIRLDMAAVYGGSYGLPEASLRKAFSTAEAVSPCVLWIDEIEAGISSQGFKAEGGVSSRILGSFLTWMQEKQAPVFVAATANAIEMLPAEVLRKGRFDEIFYVGLPDTRDREEIFRIHLSKQHVDIEHFDVTLLAGSTKGFSGAEIEQAVLSAAFEALAQGRPMTQQDLMASVSRTIPMSITMAEQIKKIEAWAFKRAVPASGKFTP